MHVNRICDAMDMLHHGVLQHAHDSDNHKVFMMQEISTTSIFDDDTHDEQYALQHPSRHDAAKRTRRKACACGHGAAVDRRSDPLARNAAAYHKQRKVADRPSRAPGAYNADPSRGPQRSDLANRLHALFGVTRLRPPTTTPTWRHWDNRDAGRILEGEMGKTSDHVPLAVRIEVHTRRRRNSKIKRDGRLGSRAISKAIGEKYEEHGQTCSTLAFARSPQQSQKHDASYRAETHGRRGRPPNDDYDARRTRQTNDDALPASCGKCYDASEKYATRPTTRAACNGTASCDMAGHEAEVVPTDNAPRQQEQRSGKKRLGRTVS